MMNKATSDAVEILGGLQPAARAMGVTYQSVQKWLRNGVPPTRVLQLESLTGVSRYELRPDVYGSR